MITDTRVQSGDKVVIWIGKVVLNSQQRHSFLYSSQNLHFLADSSSLLAALGANVNDALHHTSTTSFFMLFNSTAKCEDYIASMTE
jgi:hypothetical protein